MSEGTEHEKPEIWPIRLVFLLSLAGLGAAFLKPGLVQDLKAGPIEPVLTIALIAVLTAVLLLYPRARIWTLMGRDFLGALKTDLHTLQTDLAAVKAQLGQTATDVGSMKSDLALSKAGIDRIVADVTTVKAAPAQINIDLASLQNDLGQTKTAIDQIKSDLALIGPRLDALPADWQARLDRFEQRITDLLTAQTGHGG